MVTSMHIPSYMLFLQGNIDSLLLGNLLLSPLESGQAWWEWCCVVSKVRVENAIQLLPGWLALAGGMLALQSSRHSVRESKLSFIGRLKGETHLGRNQGCSQQPPSTTTYVTEQNFGWLLVQASSCPNQHWVEEKGDVSTDLGPHYRFMDKLNVLLG